MSTEPADDLTTILRAARAGDETAVAQLLPQVYDELRKLARARMAQLPPGQTLQPTALVHEAYVRMMGKNSEPLENRRHFFFVAARAMRDILVEQARKKAGPKAGGRHRRVQFDEADPSYETSSAEDMLALNDALADLEREDPIKAQIVNLRYFTGMNMKETADVLEMSERTLHRHWRFIRAWLKDRLSTEDE